MNLFSDKHVGVKQEMYPVSLVPPLYYCQVFLLEVRKLKQIVHSSFLQPQSESTHQQSSSHVP